MCQEMVVLIQQQVDDDGQKTFSLDTVIETQDVGESSATLKSRQGAVSDINNQLSALCMHLETVTKSVTEMDTCRRDNDSFMSCRQAKVRHRLLHDDLALTTIEHGIAFEWYVCPVVQKYRSMTGDFDTVIP